MSLEEMTSTIQYLKMETKKDIEASKSGKDGMEKSNHSYRKYKGKS